FVARHGREAARDAVRLVVTDDSAYDRLARDVPLAAEGSVSVFATAPRCEDLMRGLPGWQAERPNTSMVHGDISALRAATLPEGLVLRPVGAENGVPLEEAAAVAVASDPGITDPAADFARFLAGLPSSARLFAAVDEKGEPQATSGCNVFGEYTRIFFVN